MILDLFQGEMEVGKQKFENVLGKTVNKGFERKLQPFL